MTTNRIILLFFLFCTTTFSAEYSLTVVIENLRNNNGQLKLHLFSGPDGFPTAGKQALKTLYLPINNLTATATIGELKSGKYAIAYFHDENSNSLLDTNWLGLPKEGFGFTKDPFLLISLPSFEECAFEITDKPLLMNLKTRYIF